MAKIRIKGRIRNRFKKSQCEIGLLDTTCEILNKKLKNGIWGLKRYIQFCVYEAIVFSKESAKIRGFSLPSFELGLPMGTTDNFINAVAQCTAQNIKVSYRDFKRVGKKIGGKIRIQIIRNNLSDVLALPQAKVKTEKKKKIPVLKWLLTMGSNPIPETFGYKVRFENTGRSGGAFMQRTSNPSKFFRVDPSYSGTKQDHWLIRAMKEKQQSFENQVVEYLATKVLN